MLTVFGFYTDDTLYSKHAEMLVASANRLNINIVLRKYSKNDWQKIIAFKPTFIAQMRKELTGPILYVDADAMLLEDISSYFESIKDDLAIHYLNNEELVSGTIFINDTPNAYALLEEWERQMSAQPERWDQKVLQDLVEDWVAESKLSLHIFPANYTYIYDISKELHGDTLKPIIEHYQASRDAGWIKKYKTRSGFAKILMRYPLFSKATRQAMTRHTAVNQRTKELNINLKFKLSDLIQ